MPSVRCQAIIEQEVTPALCADFRRKRSLVMCMAWDKMDKQQTSFQEALKASWAAVTSQCQSGQAVRDTVNALVRQRGHTSVNIWTIFSGFESSVSLSEALKNLKQFTSLLRPEYQEEATELAREIEKVVV